MEHVEERASSYLAERVEERLESTGVLGGRLDSVDVDHAGPRHRPVRTHVRVKHVVVTAVSLRSQILRTHTHTYTYNRNVLYGPTPPRLRADLHDSGRQDLSPSCKGCRGGVCDASLLNNGHTQLYCCTYYYLFNPVITPPPKDLCRNVVTPSQECLTQCSKCTINP